MSTELATVQPSEIATEPAGQLLVIAENPAEMGAAQEALIEWAKAKVAALNADRNTLDEQVAQATGYGIRTTGLSGMIGRLNTEITYYEKVQAALEDGHCLVPNFPGDVVAIRTSQERPSGGAVSHYGNPNLPQQSESLDIGEGQFVSPIPTIRKRTNYVTNNKGEREQDGDWCVANKFRAVALPVKFIKPRLLDATQAAMARKVFDEICTVDGPRTVQRQKADPMIIGRIRGPKGKMLSFLIGWFIDTRDL